MLAIGSVKRGGPVLGSCKSPLTRLGLAVRRTAGRLLQALGCTVVALLIVVAIGCGKAKSPTAIATPGLGRTSVGDQSSQTPQNTQTSGQPVEPSSTGPGEHSGIGQLGPETPFSAPGVQTPIPDQSPSPGTDASSSATAGIGAGSIQIPPHRVTDLTKATPAPIKPVAPSPGNVSSQTPSGFSLPGGQSVVKAQPVNPLRAETVPGGHRSPMPRPQPVNPLRAQPRAVEPPGDDLPEAALPLFAMDPDLEQAALEGPPDELPQPAGQPGPQDPDYTVVKVFYGTDRKAVDPARAAAGGSGWWAICAVVLVAGCIYMVWSIRRGHARGALVGAGIALVAGCVAVVLGLHAAGFPVAAEMEGEAIERHYGNDRGPVELGVCRVSIPRDHRMGKIERPSVFRLEFREDPRHHVVILDLKPQPAEEFFGELREAIGQSKLRQTFVFVHGFNVTFADAARRTAQLAYDLEFEGPPIFFSWPSQGGFLQYAVDETNVAWAVPHLKQFLLDIAEQSQAESVHLIAHSMGNRALTAALQSLAYEMRDRLPLFHEVVLTAPDIDAEVFQRDIVPAIIPTARRITLYASSNDEALKLSKQIHGYRRAGDAGDTLLVVPGIDTVDVSAVDTSLIGHAYYGDNRSVLADLWDLIRESKPPQLRRWLRPVWFGQFVYWVFHRNAAPAVPADQPVSVPEL